MVKYFLGEFVFFGGCHGFGLIHFTLADVLYLGVSLDSSRLVFM
jgi:hypothetical protein